RSNEAKASAGNRNDVLVLARTLAQYAADGRNALTEIVLFDDGVRPDSLYQGSLADQLTGVLDEMEQRIECPRSQGERPPVDFEEELTLLRIEPEVAKLVDGPSVRWRHCEFSLSFTQVQKNSDSGQSCGCARQLYRGAVPSTNGRRTSMDTKRKLFSLLM